MVRALIAVVVLVALPALADHPRGDEDRMRDPVAVDRAEVDAELDELAGLLDQLANEQHPKKRTKLLSKARRRVEELRSDLARAPRLSSHRPVPPPPVVTPPPPPVVTQPPPPVVYPMHDAALAELLSALRREAFPRDRLRVLESAAPSHWVLVSQTQQVLATFEFPKDRLQAMRILRPRLLDLENAFKLYASFEFPSDKAELKQILGH